MDYSRRDFLSSIAESEILVSSARFVPEAQAGEIQKAAAQIGEFPLAKAVEIFRARQKNAPSFYRPPNLDKREYLRLIEGIVSHLPVFRMSAARLLIRLKNANGNMPRPLLRRRRRVFTRAVTTKTSCRSASRRWTRRLPI